MLKEFIVKSGEMIINVFVVLGFISSIISGLATMRFSFFGGLMTMCIGVAVVILVTFVLYLLIDIRDNLKQLNKE